MMSEETTWVEEDNNDNNNNSQCGSRFRGVWEDPAVGNLTSTGIQWLVTTTTSLTLGKTSLVTALVLKSSPGH